MKSIKFLQISPIALVLAGCQTWQQPDLDDLPPTASGPMVSEPGVMQIKYWDGLTGNRLETLTSDPDYPGNPDETAILNAIERLENRGDNYGAMAEGFLIPPADGMYRFFISSDGASEFWLSEDQFRDSASLIAAVPGYTNPQFFTKYSSQQSGLIELTGGQRYYFRVLHKEGNYNDHFTVAWEGPDFDQQPIGSDFIASWAPPIYPMTLEAREAYERGYRAGHFDGKQGNVFNPGYPPLDMDSDGLYDPWEVFHGLSPKDPSDASSDQDGDLLTASEEYLIGTSPSSIDTDSDGIPDSFEFAYELDPLNSSDATQVLNASSDITALEAYRNNLDPFTLEPLDQPVAPMPVPEETAPLMPPGTAYLSWTRPDKRVNGEELTEQDISHYRIIYGKQEGQLDQSTGEIAAGTYEYTVSDLEPGQWYFSILVTDSEGRESDPSNTVSLTVK